MREASLDANDDLGLVKEVIMGNESAWRTLVLKSQRMVRSRVADVASAFGRREDDSAIDDATAEVFAALIGHDAAPLRAYHGRSSLTSYIAVLATRSATRYFARHRLVVDQAEPAGESTGFQHDADDPVARIIDPDQQHRLQLLMDRLPPNERSVAALFHLQGHSFSQISQKLELPIGTIGPTLRQAEKRLRQWMEETIS